VARLLQMGRATVARRREAAEAVRRRSKGKSREELRHDFDSEFAERGLQRDPLWVERTLDDLERSPAQRALQKAQDMALAGSALGRMARSRGFPEPPDWMRPPENASYHGPPRRGDKVPVELDPAVTGLLDRVLEGAPGHVGDVRAAVPVWFDWDSGESEPRRVDVYVGTTRVGALDSSSSQSFSAVMKAAEESGGKPRELAELARVQHFDPPYLLAVKLPLRE